MESHSTKTKRKLVHHDGIKGGINKGSSARQLARKAFRAVQSISRLDSDQQGLAKA